MRRCVAEVLAHVTNSTGTELMVASHNQASIGAAVAVMGRLGLAPGDTRMCFGQLLGMSDHLTFTLGRNGYRVRPKCDVL